MNNLSETSPVTSENFLESIRETVRESFRETDRFLSEKFAETDRLIKENAERQKETDRLMKETDDRLKETDRLMKETDDRLKETDRLQKEFRADYERRMKKQDETLGSWATNQGDFAEEYFQTSFENGRQNFFGEKFDEILKNVKGFKKDFKDEYDILLINGKSVGIIEIKYKAHKDHIDNVLRKALTFRENFPYYANHQVYLGLATLVFSPGLEQKCIDEGIAIVKQLGDTVIINDDHLKVF